MSDGIVNCPFSYTRRVEPPESTGFKAEGIENSVPQRQKLVHAQSHGQTYSAALPASALICVQLFELVFVKVGQRLMLLKVSQSLIASVARNVFLSVGKGVYGECTVVSTALADRGF